MGKSPRPPPWTRPNWATMTESQRRYAYEQWSLSLIRRGLPIDHPFPGDDSDGPGPSEAQTAPSDTPGK